MIEGSTLALVAFMIDPLTFLATRRSVSARNMTFPGPSPEEIDKMIMVAARVPDHGKLTPWRFVVFQGAAREAASTGLAEMLAKRGTEQDRIDFARTAFTRAPVVIAVLSKAAEHPKIPIWEQQMSAGAACMNLCHAAHALGYAANWLTDWWAFDAEAKAFLGIAAGEAVVGFVHIGTPREPPQDRPRPSLANILTYWRG
jgi:nitroreductase